MDVDDLLKVADKQNEGDSETNGGLHVEFDENNNKAVMASDKASDSASDVLPSFTIDGVEDPSDPNKPEDQKDGTGGADDKSKETKEETTTGTVREDKVSTVVKLGDVSLPINLKVGEEYVLGRGKDGVTTADVSRRHAVIGRDEKGLYVMDLGSTQGTFVVGADGRQVEIPAHAKVYVNDVANIRFSKNPDGPSIVGGKAKQAKVEAPPSPSKEGDTVVMEVKPDVRPIPEIGGKAVANPDHIQRELTHGKIIGKPERIASEGESEAYRATVEIDGQKREVILRHANNRDALEQARKDLAAYELNKALGINDGFSPTSVREFEVNGERKFGTVQLVDGKNLESGLRSMAEKKFGNSSDESVKKLIEENPKLKQAIEKAYAERILLGDKSPQAKDFVITERNGEFNVRSTGLERGLASGPAALESRPGDTLNATLHSLFSGKEISAEVRAKAAEFVKTFDTPEGKQRLLDMGLSKKEQANLMARVRAVADGNFPVAETNADGAKEAEVKLTRAEAYGLRQSRNLLPSGLELKTKEQVCVHLERVRDALVDANALRGKDVTEFQALIDKYKAGDPATMKAVHGELALNIKVERTGTVAAVAAPEAVADTSVKDLEQKALTPEQSRAIAEKLLANGTFRTLFGEAGIAEEKAKQLEKDLFSKDKAVQDKAKAEIDKAYASKGGYKAFVAEAKGRAGAVALVAGPVIAALLGSDN